MKVFIINLKRSVERSITIENECKKYDLDYEFIDAVDGFTLSPSEIKTHTREINFAIRPGEIGCALSHINTYRRIVELNIDKALILEDDAQLTDDLKSILTFLESEITNVSPSVTLLTKTSQYLKKEKSRIDDTHSIHNVIDAALAHGYIINAVAAKRALEALYPVWMVADKWTLFKEYGLFHINAVIPPVINRSVLSKSSTINICGLDAEIESEIIKDGIWKILRRKRSTWVKIKRALWLFSKKPFLKIINNRKSHPFLNN